MLARVPHVQDSLTYLFQAQTLAAGKLWAPAPPLPDFFAQEFLLVYACGEPEQTKPCHVHWRFRCFQIQEPRFDEVEPVHPEILPKRTHFQAR